MNFYGQRYNLYLTVLLSLLVATGCVFGKKKKHEPIGALRIHIESTGNAQGTGQTVQILRDNPVQVTIANEPILTEEDIVQAKLVETPGGFAIEVKFDETGAWTLEQFTAANPGKHFAIFGQWSDQVKDGRWLAAPLITQRIADGIFAFTPDMSRDEAKKLVLGLNAVAKKLQTGQ